MHARRALTTAALAAVAGRDRGLLPRRGYDGRGDRTGRQDEDGRRRDPRLVGDVEEGARGVHGPDRLHRRGRAQRRRRPAHQQAGADQGVADRRPGLRHRQHLRVACRRRGRAGRLQPRGPPGVRVVVRAPGRRRGPAAHPGRLRRRVRQRRRHLVREARPHARRRTLDDLTKPAYRGLFVTPGASTSSPGLAFLLATIAKYGDAVAGVLDEADGQRRQDHRGLVRRLRGRLHRRRWPRRPADRAVLRLLAAVHDPEGRDEADHQRAARHLLPAGGVRRRAQGGEEPEGREAFLDFMEQRAFQEALPDNMYVFPVDGDAALPADCWARSRRSRPPSTRYIAVATPAEVDDVHRRRLAARRWWPTSPAGDRDRPLVEPANHPVGRSLSRPPASASPSSPSRRSSRSAFFVVLPVAGMVARGFCTDGHLDLRGVLEVLGRPRVHRVLWFTVWSAAVATVVTVLAGVPVAFVLYRLRFPRPRSAAGVRADAVRDADRGRRGRLPHPAGAVRSRRLPAAGRHAGGDRRRDGVLQPGRRGAHRRRRTGTAWTVAGRRPPPRSAPRRCRCCAPSPCPPWPPASSRPPASSSCSAPPRSASC